jgi:hypothetical protein
VAAAVSVLLLLAIGLAIGILATMGADRFISTALYVIEPKMARLAGILARVGDAHREFPRPWRDPAGCGDCVPGWCV